MDFDLDDDQQALKDSVGRLLSNHYDFGARGRHLAEADGWSRAQWRRYAEFGLLAMPFAVEDGGLGGGAVEMLIVQEALGRVLALEPWLATIILGSGLVAHAGTQAQRAAIIPPVIAGERLLAFAQAEKQSGYDLFDVATRAEPDGAGGWIVSGAKRHVLHGDCADMLVVSARTAGDRRDHQGISLFLVPTDAPGVSRRGYLLQDRLRAADIGFDGVRLSSDAVLGAPGTALPLIDRVVDTAIAALCAEAVGVMARAHEITVDYLKIRKQFGKAIGTFQVLQHRAVDMLIALEQARGMAMYAAVSSEEADPVERRHAMSAAKVQIGRSGRFIGEQAVQLHGGIGLTEDYQIGHHLRRLAMIDIMFGDADHHLGLIADNAGF